MESTAFISGWRRKSPTGPNPAHCKGSLSLVPVPTSATCTASNGYSLQLIRAGLQFIPVP